MNTATFSDVLGRHNITVPVLWDAHGVHGKREQADEIRRVAD